MVDYATQIWNDEKIDIDMAEIYRQNYLDALDEIHNLQFQLAELESKNAMLQRDIENHK